MKIVSLLPSATEIVCALGLESQLVGVSHECDYPPAVLDLPRVTRSSVSADASSGEIDAQVREQAELRQSLYSLDFPTLLDLEPDLIVTQTLCNVCAVSEADVEQAVCRLAAHPGVISLEPMSLEEVFLSILQVGEATGTRARAAEVAAALEERVNCVARRTTGIDPERRPRVAFLEWLDPLFSGGHWNPHLVELAGGIDLFGRNGERSRTLSPGALATASPDVIFIACCGFSAERTLQEASVLARLPGWSELPAVRRKRVYVADGNAYFSRPGPRLVDSLELLAHTLHPDAHPAPASHFSPVHRLFGGG